MPDLSELCTIRRAAERRDVGTSAIHKLIKRNKLQYVIHNGRKMLRIADVDNFAPLKPGPGSPKDATIVIK